jgi:anti-sigma-K factor RskA
MSVQRHDLHLLSGSYALDALADDERADFERHLARCPSCAEEVRGLRETAARLAMATAVSPPPELRERVLTAALRTRQLPPPGGRHQFARNRDRAEPRRRLLKRTGFTAGVLTLAAAIVVLLFLQVSTSRQLQRAQASNGAIAAVLAAPDARINSASATVGGTVTAVMSLREHEAVVTTAGVPSLPQARVYQLWVMTAAGTARSAGLLAVTSSGSTGPVLAAGVLPGDRLAITVEPAGGTAQPTTTPVVIMPVTT